MCTKAPSKERSADIKVKNIKAKTSPINIYVTIDDMPQTKFSIKNIMQI